MAEKPDRDPHDWYVEPPEAVEALLRVESFAGCVYDPACGQGTIPTVCIDHGYENVHASDLIYRGYTNNLFDFLSTDTLPPYIDNIVCNPPFKHLIPFIERALDLVAGKAAFIVQTPRLEGEERYRRIFSKLPLACIHQFINRVSMPPGGRGIKAEGTRIAHCWWVFDKSHQGPPTVHWIWADFEKRKAIEKLLA